MAHRRDDTRARASPILPGASGSTPGQKSAGVEVSEDPLVGDVRVAPYFAPLSVDIVAWVLLGARRATRRVAGTKSTSRRPIGPLLLQRPEVRSWHCQ